MAKRYTFRLTSEGVEELKRDLSALGTAGDAAFNKLTQAAPQLANALKLAEDSAERARTKIAAMSTDTVTAGTGARSFGAIAQQAGFQVGDFAVQVASGQSAMRAFIQQGSQLLGFFGPWGAVIGAGVAVVGALVTSLVSFEEEAKDAGKDADSFAEAQKRLAGEIQQTSNKLLAQRGTFAEWRADLNTLLQDQVRFDLALSQTVLTGLQRQREALGGLSPAQQELGLDLEVIDPVRAAEIREIEGQIAEEKKLQADLQLQITRLTLQQKGLLLEITAEEKAAAEAKKAAAGETRRAREETRRLKEEEAAAARAAEEHFREVMRGRVQFSRALSRMVDDDADKTIESSRRAAVTIRDTYAAAFDDIGGFGFGVFRQLFTGSIKDAEAAARSIEALFGQAFSFFGQSRPGGGVSGTGFIGGGGGFSSLGFSLGQYLFGTGGNPVPGTVGPPTASQAAGVTGFNSPLLGNLTGGFLGGLQYLPAILQGLNASGPGATYGQLGGGIGGAIGSIAGSFFGPVGSMIGGQLLGQLGSLVGGFFSAPNNYPKAASYLNVINGLIGLQGSASDNKGNALIPQAEQLTGTAIGQINALAQALGGSFGSGGLGYFGPGGIGGFQVKAGTFNTVVGKKVESFGQDQQAAIQNFIVEVLVQSIRGGLLQGVSGNVRKALSGDRDYDTLTELTRDINLGRLADGLGALSETAVSFQAELIKLQQEFEDTRKRAADLGFTVGGQLQEQFEASRAALEEKYFGQFRAFGRQLKQGPLSTLSPEQQFFEARTRYVDVERRALAGDALAQGQFIEAAQTYLGLARNQFASTESYAAVFNQVLSATERLGQGADTSTPVVAAVRDSGAKVVSELQGLRREVVELRKEWGRDRDRRAAGGR